MIKISPSLLSANTNRLEDEINKLEKAKADYIHFDVMDGHFVPNITFGPYILQNLKKISKIPFDIHLMVNNPAKFIPWYAKAGADIITFHLEATKNPINEINLIKSFNKKAGITIKPSTDISILLPYINDVDLVLIMSVEPGFSGQSFIDDSIERIKIVKNNLKNENILIQVDGGINQYNSQTCIDAGANFLVAGSSVFINNNYEENIKNLRGD